MLSEATCIDPYQRQRNGQVTSVGNSQTQDVDTYTCEKLHKYTFVTLKVIFTYTRCQLHNGNDGQPNLVY